MADTRRRFLGQAAVAMPAAALPTMALARSVEPHPDAVLLQLGEQLAASFAQEKASWEDENDMDDDPAYQASSAIVDCISQLPARTLDGMRVKAKAIEWCQGGYVMTLTRRNSTTDERIAASIVRDLLAT